MRCDEMEQILKGEMVGMKATKEILNWIEMDIRVKENLKDLAKDYEKNQTELILLKKIKEWIIKE